MKRAQVVFVLVVFGALAAGFLAEHGRGDGPLDEPRFAAVRRPVFDPLQLPLGGHRLAGVVQTSAGIPAADVEIVLYRAEPPAGVAEPPIWTFTDAEGRFELTELKDTTYEVALVLPGHPIVPFEVALPHPEEIAWTLPARLEPLPLLPELHRTDLAGRLFPPVGLTEEQYPVAGYEIALLPAETDHRLSGAVVLRTLTDADGGFRFEGIAAADYVVQVLPEWASGGSWPVLDEVFHRLEPRPPRDAVLRMRLRCGEVSGAVVEPTGDPVRGALVRVWPEGARERIWPPTITDAQGRFLVRDLPTGRYTVRAHAGTAVVELGVGVEAGTRLEVPLEPIEPGPASEDA